MTNQTIKDDTKERPEDDEKKLSHKTPKKMGEPEEICPQDISMAQILSLIENSNEKLDGLTRLFEDKIAEDETKGILFEKLYGELSQYRDDFVFDKILKRLFLDLIGLFDRIVEVKEQVNPSELVSGDIIENLNSFCEEILQILKKQEVTLIENAEELFNEEFQEAMDIEVTNIPSDNLKIAQIIKKGFIFRGHRLLRPEIVTIKKYKED